jgi:hypothetical protein
MNKINNKSRATVIAVTAVTSAETPATTRAATNTTAAIPTTTMITCTRCFKTFEA